MLDSNRSAEDIQALMNSGALNVADLESGRILEAALDSNMTNKEIAELSNETTLDAIVKQGFEVLFELLYLTLVEHMQRHY